MADSFLRRWFGRAQAAGPAVEEARVALERLRADREALQPLVRLLLAILPDLAPLESHSRTIRIDPERARARLREGVSLLRGEPVAVDAEAFCQRWRRACEALAEQQADEAGLALMAIRSGRLDPGWMVTAVLEGRPEVVRLRAEELGLEPGLVSTLLRFTLFGVFTALEGALADLRAGIVWERGYCPTCGSWPLLGEFRGLDQSRFLRCGLCASGWEVPRLWCPFCGNRDHERLGLLHEEGKEAKDRASLCDDCRGYVKMVSTLSALPPLQMLVADAATLHLDLAAAARGYTNHF